MAKTKTKTKTNAVAVKLTLTDLINKKLQKKSTEVKFKNIYVKKLDGELLFKIPTEDEVFDVLDEVQENKSTKHIKEVYTKLIFRQCDTLHEKELLESYGITRGFDIVDILFSTSDIMNVGNALVGEVDLDDENEEIKK